MASRKVVGKDWPWRLVHLPRPIDQPPPVTVWAYPEEDDPMVAVKNPTYVGKGPGVPTTAVPPYVAGDAYYPKGSMGLAATEGGPEPKPEDEPPAKTPSSDEYPAQAPKPTEPVPPDPPPPEDDDTEENA